MYHKNAGGAYVPAFFAGMYAPLRRAHARNQHVCPARRTMQRGAYITTKGVVTYAPPAYLKNKGTLEAAQHIANHRSPRTTKLYDRREDDISLDEVERIAI